MARARANNPTFRSLLRHRQLAVARGSRSRDGARTRWNGSFCACCPAVTHARYRKTYVQTVLNDGSVKSEFKQSIGPNGVADVEFVHGAVKYVSERAPKYGF
jgi:hypothetical protein